MSIGLIHPYYSYLLYFVITTSLIGWVADFIKIKSNTITIAIGLIFYLSVVAFGIINSLFIIFVFSAGHILNYDFFTNIFLIGIYIYVARMFIKAFEFEDIEANNILLKKLPFIAILGPFIISFLVFYFIYYGDKIYKLSPHCQNTENPKIKFCKYSNGTYTGEMKAFRRHGHGEYIWDSGKTYKGEWKNSLMDGKGEMLKNGDVIKGTWKKHKFFK